LKPRQIYILALIALIVPAVGVGQYPSSGDPAQIENLVYLTEQAPPFNFQDNGTIRGISVDLLERVLLRMGTSLNRSDIKLQAWSKSYEAALSDKNAVLFITAYLPERAPKFKWVGPIFSTKTTIYALKDRKVRLNLAHSPQDLMKYKIAVVRDEYAEQLLMNLGAKDLIEVESGDLITKMMKNGSVDAWGCSDLVGTYLMGKAGINLDDVEAIYDLGDVKLFYALNKDAPDSLVGKFQNALNDAKMNNSIDGTSDLEKILYKYLPVKYSTNIVPDGRVTELVNKASEDVGKDAPGTFKRISTRDPLYLEGDYPELYIFVYDTNETWVAHANNPEMVGTNFKGKADVSGKKFSDEIVTGALKNGTGWEDYIYINPVEAGLYYKATYYRLAKGSDGKQYVVCGGKYKDEK
jgi:polar amino acid transport system substrate-binding protein